MMHEQDRKGWLDGAVSEPEGCMSIDFQKVVDGIGAMSCVVSVEMLPDGGCGEIRIVTGNRAYIDSIEHPAQDVEMLSKKFVPNSLYTTYMTRDLNFEDFCYRAAVQKKCLHSYAHPDRYDVWFNMTFLPVEPDQGNLRHCLYTMEINLEPSSERISNISGDIASAVLETAISLRAARDFKAAMKDTVRDVRRLCEAEYCGILLVNDEEQSCEVLGEDFAEDSLLKPDDNYLETDFYSVSRTWKDTISGSNCLIAKNERDMEVVAERNPLWCRSLRDAGVKTVALFPLKSRNEYLGYMWATNFKEENSARIKEILELTTFVLSSEISNDLMMNRLKELSSRDMLTGVMNRNEMNNYVDRLIGLRDVRKFSAGVIFADLNGLKRINDTKGHNAGDLLLKNAALALCEQFESREIFRAGGDEFVVILLNVSCEQLEEKVQALHASSEHYPGLSFAVGYSLTQDCRDVRKALAEADERMYMDKQLYYAQRGGK